jgi:ribosomal protein S5
MNVRHDPMDWRASKPAHKTPARRLPKAVRKALRDYRRNVIPMADSDTITWPVLALIGVVAVAILLWQAGVFA